jgi:hypothetical protein
MALRIILEAKDTLFGSYSDSLTKQDKRRKWEEMATKYQSLGVISAAKDYKYVRDVYWPNIKKTTIQYKYSLLHTSKHESNKHNNLLKNRC